MSHRQIVSSVLGVLVTLATLLGCGDQNDPGYWVGKLDDAVYRRQAIEQISRLYGTALSKNGGNRQAAPVKAIADTTIGPLVETYRGHAEDNQNRIRIVKLLKDMRDPRAMPALLAALEFTPDINEEGAAAAAEAIALISPPQTAAIPKLGEAYGRISGARGVDNRLRISFIRALAMMNDRAAVPHLVRIMETDSESQTYIINFLAASKIGEFRDPSSVGPLILAMFRCRVEQGRINKLDGAAVASLVRIGRPALQPLIDTLQGRNAEALAATTRCLEQVRRRIPEAPNEPQAEVVRLAAYAIGQIGFAEGIAPLRAVLADPKPSTRLAAAVSLASIGRAPELFDAISPLYVRCAGDATEAQQRTCFPDERMRGQLLVALRRLNDARAIPIFQRIAQDADEDIQNRGLAFQGLVYLGGAEAIALAQATIAAEERRGDDAIMTESFREVLPILELTRSCTTVACWVGKLGDRDAKIVRKAAHMLVLTAGAESAAAVTGLVANLGHSNEEARVEILYALDALSPRGNAAAIARIDELERAEEGRAIWEHTKQNMLQTRARLAARASGG